MKRHLKELLVRSFNQQLREKKMAKIVVDVMLKPEILDPQGKAVAAALPRLGFTFATDVRQGKRFEITVDGEPTAVQLAEVEIAAEKLLSNPVIENFVVRVEK
jgi:phosphoribosylformylglycinamidine synthase